MPEAPTDPTDDKDTPLFHAVFQTISKTEDLSIPFSDYMRLVLYHPEQGYYSRLSENRIGREGDFYTSVTVGETFGFLLAQKISTEWRTRFKSSGEFVVVEQGAHDGALALDIVLGIREIDPELAEEFRYRIVEPRQEHRNWLEERFSGERGGKSIKVLPSLSSAQAEKGIFLCNELVDAFPFDCVRMENGEWRERKVGIDEAGNLCWKSGGVDERFVAYVSDLDVEFPEGYTTEFSPGINGWVAEASGLFSKGLWWVIDYGYDAEDYYSTVRSSGTMRCFREHRATEDPFEEPGNVDITAHVDFSRIGAAAEGYGMKVEEFTDQHHFLIEAAKPWLMGLEGAAPGAQTSKRLRQFQTLTHPSIMGQQFKVMVLAK